MGNDHSYLSGIDIVEKAVEICDYWSQHSAALIDDENINSLTVFIGENFVDGPLWSSQTPLEKNAKNLMIYRHPCIVKYVSSWHKNSKFYLAVEEINPLSQELLKLNLLQTSVGLYSILKALQFLHTNALVSHNNLCVTSVYIGKDGTWKLGSMEYLCKYKDLNSDYLNKTKSHRCSKNIDPNEDILLQSKEHRSDFVDIYAFGVLAYDILKSKTENDIPHLSDFLEFCKNNIQNKDISKRPNFKEIIEHEFFNHEFIKIHSFLLELPLKNDNERTIFFQTLTEKLMEFDEEIVASQMSSLLLSRMVLLNKSAQNTLLPSLLTPGDGKLGSSSLFTKETFRKYLCPKLLEIFEVRDIEIRLLLLQYFPNYMNTFTKEELQNKVLPELLVGIKDTNDHLVSVTLKTLANLVPILGSATVIGGKRAKLFNDGGPIRSTRKPSRNIKTVNQNLPTNTIQTSGEADQISISSLGTEVNNTIDLPERPRPDGEEGETSTEEIEPSMDEDLDNWEDWDVNEQHHQSTNSYPIDVNEEQIIETVRTEPDDVQNKPKLLIPDITELDIKNQTRLTEENEINFFQDMEPVIEITSQYIIEDAASETGLQKQISNKLALNATDDENNAGWEDDDWD